MNNPKRALISVADKTGVLGFSQSLIRLGFEIISTGGTYQYLQENKVKAIAVENLTKFPEILDGRVKTLHPLIHGAILAKKNDPQHLKELQTHEISAIDLVCVNLYPFESTINKSNCTVNDAIENIDIGGVTLIRAAAKNFQNVTLVTANEDYSKIIDEIQDNAEVSIETRRYLAYKGFSHTTYYDSIISKYFLEQVVNSSDASVLLPEISIPGKLVHKLRYGENAYQKAAFYQDPGDISGLLASFQQHQGKDLSYNNLADADTAWECVKQFNFLPENVNLKAYQSACVIVKHANPCGVALGENALDSYQRAYSCDPVSSFGGIIAFNSEVNATLATVLIKQFLEVLIAPLYTAEALAILQQKPNIRVLQIKLVNNSNKLDYKRIGGGLLVQDPEAKILYPTMLKTVTKKQASSAMKLELYFAWCVARFVKSNAIVLVKDMQTIGIGAGQMSRIDSTKIAIAKAEEFGFKVKGSVCASDAFFPFRDNVDVLAKHGITAVIQPGGSIKDIEVFAAANEHELVMLVTGYRIFRH
jgi:phosphoribosylaminoimidazolecarboxamide formyltransferase / IMP cyclohydrolase